MIPPSPDGATHHIGSKRVQWFHHSVITTAVDSKIPEHAQCNGTPSRLCAHLFRSQHLLTDLLLSSPSPVTFTRNPRYQLPKRDIPPSHSPIIVRLIKRATTRDAGTGPPCHGAGISLQGRSWVDHGTTVQHGHHDPGYLTQ